MQHSFEALSPAAVVSMMRKSWQVGVDRRPLLSQADPVEHLNAQQQRKPGLY